MQYLQLMMHDLIAVLAVPVTLSLREFAPIETLEPAVVTEC
jgi:hypothetical protein